MINEVEDTKG